ncbi:MAG TPA: ABC transporter [Bradyrhizobium sp.]
MPGTSPGMTKSRTSNEAKNVDGRDKPGHDEFWASFTEK